MDYSNGDGGYTSLNNSSRSPNAQYNNQINPDQSMNEALIDGDDDYGENI